jgi:hypothetical protein
MPSWILPNLNDTTPAAPAGHSNGKWQVGDPYTDGQGIRRRDTSVYFPDSGNRANGEVVSGSGNNFTLDHAPSPAESLILVQRLPTFGGVVLFQEEGSPVMGDYALAGANITTTNSIAAGALRAWYTW